MDDYDAIGKELARLSPRRVEAALKRAQALANRAPRVTRLLITAEDDATFASRRADEERRKMSETSCMIRSLHEELADLYDEARVQIERETSALEMLLKRIK